MEHPPFSSEQMTPEGISCSIPIKSHQIPWNPIWNTIKSIKIPLTSSMFDGPFSSQIRQDALCCQGRSCRLCRWLSGFSIQVVSGLGQIADLKSAGASHLVNGLYPHSYIWNIPTYIRDCTMGYIYIIYIYTFIHMYIMDHEPLTKWDAHSSIKYLL